MTEINEQATKLHYTPKKIQNDADKSESTKLEYLKEAEGFLIRELDKKGITRTAGNICKALKIWSGSVEANTYIKKQCALEYHQYKKKFYKSAEQIRNTQRINYGITGNGEKKPHCKTVKERQHVNLSLEANKKGDKESAAALTIAYFLGLRPSEMHHIEYSDEDDADNFLIYVRSAKANEDGTRSIDKVIKVELDESSRRQLINDINSMSGLTGNQIRNMRVRVCRLSKKLFPKLKKRPTLYSYRHQLGADLKGAKSKDGSKLVDRKEAAATFGHRSQNSLNSYGHANISGGLRRPIPRATEEVIALVNDDLRDTGYMAKHNAEHGISGDAVSAKQEPEASPEPSKQSLAEFVLQQMNKSESSSSEESKDVEQKGKDKEIKTSRHDKSDDDFSI